MNYISAILGFIAATALLLTIFTGGPGGKAPVVLLNEEQYEGDAFPLQFVYPDSYALKETRTGNGERDRYDILLTPRPLESEEEGSLGSSSRYTITISVFQNDIDELTPREFIEKSSFSNFKQSPDGEITPVTLSGVQAYWYMWDASFRGESLVLREGDWIYMFSVTYGSSKDQIWKDYRDLLKTVRFP